MPVASGEAAPANGFDSCRISARYDDDRGMSSVASRCRLALHQGNRGDEAANERLNKHPSNAD
jgi:hypothetical protein